MAKVQTFGDKLKKAKADDSTSVKVIKWYKDENRDTLRILQRFVKVKDMSELDTIDISR